MCSNTSTSSVTFWVLHFRGFTPRWCILLFSLSLCLFSLFSLISLLSILFSSSLLSSYYPSLSIFSLFWCLTINEISEISPNGGIKIVYTNTINTCGYLNLPRVSTFTVFCDPSSEFSLNCMLLSFILHLLYLLPFLLLI